MTTTGKKSKLVIVFLVVAVLTGVAIYGGIHYSSWNRLRATGLDALKNKRWDEAKVFFQQANMKWHSSELDNLLKKTDFGKINDDSVTLANQTRWEAAQKLLQKPPALLPEDSATLNKLSQDINRTLDAIKLVAAEEWEQGIAQLSALPPESAVAAGVGAELKKAYLLYIKNLRDKMNWATLEKVSEQCLARFGDLNEALRARAEAQLNLNKIDAARQSVESLLKLYPEDRMATLLLARIHTAAGKKQEALALLKKLQPESNNIDGVALLQARILLDEDRPFEALKALDSSDALSAEGLFLQGQILALVGDPEQGACKISLAAEQKPNPAYYAEEARLWLVCRKLTLAENAALRALKLDPDNRHALGITMTVYLHNGELMKALEYSNRALKNNPDEKHFYELAGEINLRLKKYPVALQQFHEAIRRSPENPLWQIRKLYILNQTNDIPGAFNLAETLVKTHPENTDVLALAAWANFKNARPPVALELLAKAAKLPSRSPYEYLVPVLFATDPAAKQKAVANLEQALRMFPANNDLRETLAASCEQGGNTGGALAQWQAIVEREPGNLTALRNCARLCFSLSQFPETITYAQKARETNDASEETFNVLLLSCLYENRTRDILSLVDTPIFKNNPARKTDGFKFRAYAYLMAEQLDKATAELGELGKIPPPDQEFYALHSMLAAANNQPPQAMQHFQMSFQNPQNRFNLASLERVFVKAGNYPAAENFLNVMLNTDPNNLRYRLKRAEILMQEAKYPQMAQDTAFILQKMPNNATALRYEGLARVKQNNFKEALDFFVRAAHKSEPDADLLYQRAFCRYMTGDKDLAAAEVAQALALNPENANALYLRARILFDQGNSKECMRNLHNVLRINSSLAPALALRARIYYNNQRYETALSDVNDALVYDPNNIEYLRLKGDALLARGKADEAYQALAAIANNFPNDVELLRELGRLALLQNDFPNAKTYYLKLLQINQSFPETFVGLANIDMEANSLDTASQFLDKAFALSPKHTGALTAAGRLASLKKDYPNAMRLLTEAIKSGEKTVRVFQERAMVYRKLKKFEEAASDFVQAEIIEPYNVTPYLLRAETFQLAGRPEKAEMVYTQLLAKIPSYQPALLLRARVRASLKNYESANKDIETFLNDLPNRFSPEAFRERAFISYQQGNMQQAVQLFTQYQQYLYGKPLSPEDMYLRGLLHAGSGQLNEAASMFTQAVTAKPDFMPPYLERAGVYLTMKNAPAAVLDLNKYMESCAETPALLTKKAQAEILTSAFNDALKDVNRALELDPESLDLRLLRLSVLTSLKKIDEIEDDLNVVLLDKPNDLNLRLQRAQIHCEKGKIESALKDLQQVLTGNPNNAEALILRGQCYLQQKKYDLCTADLQKARTLAPQDARPFMYLAQRWSADKKDDEVTKIFAEALRILPNHPDIAFQRGQFYFDRKQLDPAAADLDLCLKINPENDKALLLRARILKEKGNYAGALTDIEKFLGKNPRSAEGLILRGDVRQQTREYLKAADDFILAESLTKAVEEPLLARAGEALVLGNKPEKALEILQDDYESAPVLVARAKACLALNRTKDAVRALEKAANSEDAGPAVNLQLAEIYLKTKQPDRALEYLEKSAAQSKGDKDAALLTAETFLQLGKNVEALDLLSKTFEKSENYPPHALAIQGVCYFNLEQHARAAKALQAAREKGLSNLDLLVKLSLSSLKTGAYAEAKRYASDALALDEKNVEAALVDIEASIFLRQTTTARARVNKLLEDNPKNPTAHFLKGEIFYLDGLPQPAVKEFEQALTLSSKSPAFLLDKGQTLLDLGLPSVAKKAVALLDDNNLRNPADQMAMGVLLYKTGETKKARQILETLAKNGDAPLASFWLGVLLQRSEEHQAAVEKFTQYLAIDKTDARALAYRGLSWLELQQAQKALDDFNKALELDPTLDFVFRHKEKAQKALIFTVIKPVK